MTRLQAMPKHLNEMYADGEIPWGDAAPAISRRIAPYLSRRGV